MWPILYVLFVLVAMSAPPGAMADDESDFQIDEVTDTTADITPEAQRWAFTKSLRVELAKSDHVRLETTIPLDQTEKSKLTLGFQTKMSRNWSFNLNLWAVL